MWEKMIKTQNCVCVFVFVKMFGIFGCITLCCTTQTILDHLALQPVIILVGLCQ